MKYKLNREYLRQIILVFTVSLVTIVIISNITNYFYSSKILRDYISEDYLRSTTRVQQTFRAEADTLEDLVEYVYLSDVVQNEDKLKSQDFIVYSKLKDLYGVIKVSNPYLGSVQYYDSGKKRLFTAGASALTNSETQLKEIMSISERIVPKKIIVRDMSYYEHSSIKTKKVFSCFMFGGYNLTGGSDFFVINVEFDWLYNAIHEDNISGVALFDENKELLFTKGDAIEERIYRSAIEECNEDSYDKIVNKKKYIMYFEDFGGIGITMCRIASLSKAYPELSAYIWNIIIFIMLFVALGIVIAVYASKTVYKPINSIFKEVATEQVGKINEIEYIREVLKKYRAENKRYSDMISGEEEILKSYSFNKIMRSSEEMSEKEIERCFSYLDIPIDSNFAVVILRINKIDGEVGQKDGLINYALYNVSTEIIGGLYGVESLFVMSGDIELLVNVSDNNYVQKLRSCFNKISECMQTQFNAVVSMSVSRVSDGIDGISDVRTQALNNLKFNFNVGSGRFFTFDDDIYKSDYTVDNIRTLQYEEELKWCVSEEKALEIVNAIFDRIKKLPYEKSVLEIVYFTKIFGEIFDLNEELMTSLVNPDVELTISDILENVEESIRSKFAEENGHRAESVVGRDLIRSTIEFIENNFPDPNLCITMAAEHEGISTRKMSKFFVDEMGMRFNEYLIDFRIQKAKELMLSGDLSIKDISKSIGIENDTYFYKRFKEKCGMTPNEFRKNNKR